MANSLPLLHGDITLEEALDNENDILHRLEYPAKREAFVLFLLDHVEDLEIIVAFHLGVPHKICKVQVAELIHGSFNYCVPVHIHESAGCRIQRVIIRFPLPYKIGDAAFPGNTEEKLRAEVATHIWIANNCPDVPVPSLRGFGFPSGRCFTAPGDTPLLWRMAWSALRNIRRVLGYPVPSQFIPRQSPVKLDSSYLIVDYVQNGEMLSKSWESLRHDQDRKANLFAGLSRIILSLARLPFPRIGSLTIDDLGIIELRNRPLTSQIHLLENLGIPTNIPRDLTYITADAYLSDVLGCHDSRMLHMPNSMNNRQDGYEQLSALVIMRALLPHFTDPALRHGPFTLMLTDLHQSNIFVDSDWRITAVIDLEWTAALPREMQHPPTWLSGMHIDGIDGDELEVYARLHAEFLAAFEAEERALGLVDIPNTKLLGRSWETGSFWYFLALDCPNGLYNLYLSHVQGRFGKMEDFGSTFEQGASSFWCRNVNDFITGKVEAKKAYMDRVRERFAARRELEDNGD